MPDTNKCAIPRCGKEVASGKAVCSSHAARLPYLLQRELFYSARSGNPRALKDAVAAAQEHLRGARR